MSDWFRIILLVLFIGLGLNAIYFEIIMRTTPITTDRCSRIEKTKQRSTTIFSNDPFVYYTKFACSNFDFDTNLKSVYEQAGEETVLDLRCLGNYCRIEGVNNEMDRNKRRLSY